MSKAIIIPLEVGVSKLKYSTLIENIDNPYCQIELEERLKPFLKEKTRQKVRKKIDNQNSKQKKGR